jgi:hypothetical protein
MKAPPNLYKLDGTPVTDYSWTCPADGSCWTRFHDFYEPLGLFSRKEINMNEKKIKFAGTLYGNELYQKKYISLGISVSQTTTSGRKTCMAKINNKIHMGKET